MTDINVDLDNDFEDSSDEFAKKDDMLNRLVLIYPTGKTGMRQSTTPGGKPYQYYETYTIVLDDGPDGYQSQIMDYDTEKTRANRIPSVAEEGIQILPGYQWSVGGVKIRIEHKVPAENDGKPKGLLGRIDRKASPGKAAAWRTNSPTDADRELALSPEGKAARVSVLKSIDAILNPVESAADEEAF